MADDGRPCADLLKMKALAKRAVKRLIDLSVTGLGKHAIGRYLFGEIVQNVVSRVAEVEHRGSRLTFSIASALSKFRVDTFSTKEPETLEWIDRIPHGSVMWDVGANIGLYACYAAKARDCRVFAFEPSVFNLEALARNIFLNQLVGRITVVPLPLSDKLAVSSLGMTSTDWGAALSTFGQPYGHDGEPLRKVFEFPTIGLSMVDAVDLLRIPQPDYIKVDVDGIEHLILKSGIPILRRARSVLVEINDRFAMQVESTSKSLHEAGLSLMEKRHAAYFDSHLGAERYTFNQIWSR
jgi:FkbM family methyltransferase